MELMLLHHHFDVLLTVQLSIFISVINQLDVLIIRRSKLHYTASGIIKPIGLMIPEAV